MPAQAPATSRVFLDQAAQCEGRSALYADLCRRYAADPVAAEIVGPDPGWDAPLRLLGGLHYLVLGGEARWDDPLAEHREFLREFVATQGVQTNEVQRSWVLLPLFLRVAERTRASELDLIELGPSAGLNLFWDRYFYRYEGGAWGPPGSPLRLEGEERRPVPATLLELAPRVRTHIGIDRAPIDVTSEHGSRLLRSFVWAGQHARMARLEAAIDALRDDPPQLVRGDFVETLPEILAGRPCDRLTVVFQTASFGYLSNEDRDRVRGALEAFGEEHALAFISAGQPRVPKDDRWGLRLVYWPGGEREFAGHADWHGSWIEWDL